MMILPSALIATLLISQTVYSAENNKKSSVTDHFTSEDITIPIIAVDIVSKERDAFSNSPTVEAFEPLYYEDFVEPNEKANYDDPSQNDALISPEQRGQSDKRDEYYEDLAKKAENAFPSLRPLKYKPDSQDEIQAGASADDYYVPRPTLDINKPYKQTDYDEYFPKMRHIDLTKKERDFGYDSMEFTPKPGFLSSGFDINEPKSIERMPTSSSREEPPYVNTKSEYYKPSNPEPYSNSEYYKPSNEETYAKDGSYKSNRPDSYIKSDFYKKSTPDLYTPEYFKSSNPNAYSMSDYYKSPNPDVYSKPDHYQETNPDAYSKLNYYKESNPDAYSKPNYYKEPNPDAYSKPDYYKPSNADEYPKPGFYETNPDAYSKPDYYTAPTPDVYSSSEYFKPMNTDSFSKPIFRKSALPSINTEPTYHQTSSLDAYPRTVPTFPKKYRSRSRNAVPKSRNVSVSSRNTKTSKMSSLPASSYPKTSVKRPKIGSKKRNNPKPSSDIYERHSGYLENEYPSRPLTDAYKSEKRNIAPTLNSEEGRLFLAAANYGKPVREQFHEQGTEGAHSYKFGYNTGDKDNPMARYEERDADGLVKGSYSFVDAMGQLKVVKYESHPVFGFRTTAS